MQATHGDTEEEEEEEEEVMASPEGYGVVGVGVPFGNMILYIFWYVNSNDEDKLFCVCQKLLFMVIYGCVVSATAFISEHLHTTALKKI